LTELYFEIPGYNNRTIKADLRHNSSIPKVPIVILSHGFKSFRNWGFMPYLSSQIADNNICINFDFSWNGIFDDKKMIYDVDIFAQNTISSMIFDLNLLIKNINNNSIEKISSVIKNHWNGNIILFGHSLGGAISINIVNQFNNIQKLVLWGSIAKYTRNTKKQIEDWKNKGTMNFKDQKTGQELYLNYSYYKDKEDNDQNYHILNKIKNIKQDTLIIHGEQDITISPKEAYSLFKNSIADEKILRIINGCGHTFGVEHPFQNARKQLTEAINMTKWFIEK